ncbi:Endopolyphosphatase [Xylographa pallens]|nr:Endopolyphosphatase [Xylographa pallens]
MHLLILIHLLRALSSTYAAPTTQKPLLSTSHEDGLEDNLTRGSSGRPLRGRFLHISDLHPDPFYKYHSSSSQEDACHRGEGPAGILGAETTDCDSPISLINATFKWIDDNLKDEIDFVIWTGDSARHDNDEQIPRTVEQVASLNRMVVNKFVEVFGKEENINDTDPTNDFIIPIIPTWGNNDILPHNILAKGPNLWTKRYLDIWRKFIPEEQRHSFERGGWFYVEVIPNKLAVLSLNTLYFFDSNAAVDGCADPSEPGHQHLEWLRIQLQFLRQRGMKAILMGHVPPARTESKMSWDETCWQRYTLWLHQYRDVVVGSVYGHMNIDHFMLQDSHSLDLLSLLGTNEAARRTSIGDEINVQSAASYLTELRSEWSHLPKLPKVSSKKGNGHSKEEKFLKNIGGPRGERYSLSLVSPSVIPNYFPSLRVIEYNITNAEIRSPTSTILKARVDGHDRNLLELCRVVDRERRNEDLGIAILCNQAMDGSIDYKAKRPKFKIPRGPSKLSPPGPAYSPQTFSWLGYTQYYANLTEINDDFTNTTMPRTMTEGVVGSGWKDGKHHGKHPKKSNPSPSKFEFEIEYDTRDDKIFGLEDLTVKSYVTLAGRIGQYKPKKGDRISTQISDEKSSAQKPEGHDLLESGKKHKKKKKHRKHPKHEKRKAINRVWFTFVRRAFVGSRDDSDLHDEFGQPIGLFQDS